LEVEVSPGRLWQFNFVELTKISIHISYGKYSKGLKITQINIHDLKNNLISWDLNPEPHTCSTWGCQNT